MTRDTKESLWIAVMTVLVLVIFASGAWYQASVQAESYQRQGATISTWEVLMGAKPIERSVTIKEKP